MPVETLISFGSISGNQNFSSNFTTLPDSDRVSHKVWTKICNLLSFCSVLVFDLSSLPHHHHHRHHHHTGSTHTHTDTKKEEGKKKPEKEKRNQKGKDNSKSGNQQRHKGAQLIQEPKSPSPCGSNIREPDYLRH